MRRLLRTLALGLLLAHPAPPALAQEGTTTLLAGYGGIDHEADLGPAFHLNLRRRMVRWDSIPLSPPGPDRNYLPAFELHAEAFGQLGEGGTDVVPCEEMAERLCVRGADPVYLLGAGIVGRADVTSARRSVVLYFIPASVGIYLRGYELDEHQVGVPESTSRRELRVSGGVGNGFGLRVRVGGMLALLEVRAILVRDLGGGRGGSLPVSLGLAW